MIVLRQCQRVHVEGVTLMNSPMFHLVPSRCQDVLIENIRIVAPSDAPNTDAMDPAGHRILIRNCELDIGDDNSPSAAPPAAPRTSSSNTAPASTATASPSAARPSADSTTSSSATAPSTAATTASESKAIEAAAVSSTTSAITTSP